MGAALVSAISGLEPVDLDDKPAADTRPGAVIGHQDSDWTAPDCGEGDLFDDPDEDAKLLALIHEQDPGWTPPGRGNSAGPGGTVSWMEVVRNATEHDIQVKVAAHGATVRGFVRLT